MTDPERRKIPETEEDLFDAFLTLTGETAPNTEDEIRTFLEASGYDVEELTARAERVFKPALAASPLNWRNRARKEMNAAREKISESIRRNVIDRQEIIARIQSVLMRPGLAPTTLFRNIDLENISDEDLQSIWEEYEFLQADDEN